MGKLQISITAAAIAAARKQRMSPERFDKILTWVLQEYPGLTGAPGSKAGDNALEFSGLDELRATAQVHEDTLVRNVVRQSINKQLATRKDIFWVPYKADGVNYTLGYAPGNVRYKIAPYLNSRAAKNKFIVLRERMENYHSYSLGRDYLSSDLVKLIKATGGKGHGKTDLQSYLVEVYDDFSQTTRREDIKIKNFMFGEISARVFGLSAHESLSGAQAACAADLARWLNPEELSWTVDLDTFDEFYGQGRNGSSEDYYRISREGKKGFRVVFCTGKPAVPPRLLRENEPDADLALEACHSDWAKLLENAAAAAKTR